MSKANLDELSLKATEAQVLAEGREWTRQRLQQRLQAQAQAASALFPPAPTPDPPLDPAHRRRRRDPQRRLRPRSPDQPVGVSSAGTLGFGAHQKMTPELEDRVCLTATLADSYDAAATLAAKWGSPVDASTIRQHACAVGQRAAAQAHARADAPTPAVAPPAGVKAPGPAALVIMMDGWLARQRGEDWGAPPTGAALERVAWHEIKGAVIYRLEQAGHTAGGRGVIAQKHVVAWQGEPLEFGRRVQAEAQRHGLAQAEEVFVVADGSVWIWNVQADRFGRAHGVLDFYHASQHLWSLAHALYPADEVAARAWVAPLLHQLRHGQESSVLQTLADLSAGCAPQLRPLPPEVAREREYFANHCEHVHYEAMAAKGCPVGSGAMESFCAQLQGRFKRCGQFWSRRGFGDLLALDVARRNLDWDALWSKN